ncbi:MAG: polyribonucleotide nucleotidyltransferase, partial [Candidatus Zixiibacteriota bacterium]
MKKPILEKSIDIAGRPLSLQVGKFAEQADASVLGRYGDTIVLVTVVCGPKTENGGFLPLRVDYEEKLYAGGRIKGSRFVKREGRPSEEAVLNARIIDRSIRPLFPKDFPREVQVVVTVLSIDLNNDPVLTAIAATSAALLISGIPWKGPLAAVKVGLSNGDFILNPRENELEFSHLDLLVSGTQKEIIMIEAAAEEIPEEQIIKALEFSTPHLDTLNKFIQEFASPAAEPEIAYEIPEIDPTLKGQLLRFIKENFPKDSLAPNHKVRDAASEEFLQTLYERFEGKCSKQEMKRLFEQELKHVMREQILKEGKRFDGRSLNEIRPLEIEVDLLPRTHGSAMFRRGGTQVLTITTLASTSLEQLIETMTGEETKRYIHHYNFPPFSTGEVGRLGYPKRREIGHGALAEKALLPVIPGEKTFPYTIRVVSEVLSSAGSTSQASVCGSSLSLMDAGVP